MFNNRKAKEEHLDSPFAQVYLQFANDEEITLLAALADHGSQAHAGRMVSRARIVRFRVLDAVVGLSDPLPLWQATLTMTALVSEFLLAYGTKRERTNGLEVLEAYFTLHGGFAFTLPGDIAAFARGIEVSYEDQYASEEQFAESFLIQSIDKVKETSSKSQEAAYQHADREKVQSWIDANYASSNGHFFKKEQQR